MARERIHKVLAELGVASRRAVEEMILEGRVSVNGSPVSKLPCFVDLDVDEVRIDGKSLRAKKHAHRKHYLLLNKPRGVVCTQQDPDGRPRAADLAPDVKERIYPVGRLDVETTGLIILTNDGDLTEYLTHPRYGVEKTYVASVDGHVRGEDIDSLRKGVYIDGKRAQGAKVKILRRGPQRSLVEIRLSEGRNREVRRILAKFGYKVRRLKRTAIGPLTDQGLKIGSSRFLKSGEIRRLFKCGSREWDGGVQPAGRSGRKPKPHKH